MTKKKTSNLTVKMLIAMVAGLLFGLAMIALRENLNASGGAETWAKINSLLFADISAAGNEKAIGLFYLIG